MIWTLSKLGLTSNLRRVSDEKILLAEMREACRQADRLKAIEPEAALCEKAMEVFHNFFTTSHRQLLRTRRSHIW